MYTGKTVLKWKMPTANQTAWAGTASTPALELRAENGTVRCAVRYDFRAEPLRLAAAANPGDCITLTLRPYRLELAVNGAVEDEEWPAGRCAYACGDAIQGALTVDAAQEPDLPAAPAPAVLRTFTHAEGWRPSARVFVGDCMPYVDQGRYHVLYLKDRRHHRSKWGLGAHQWAHISTADFCTWAEHPMAVEITDPMEGSICTGSWIFQQGRHELYYTVRRADGAAAPICRSLSADGIHFAKDPSFRLQLSERYDGPSARVPKVIRDAQGAGHMFVTTTQQSTGRGCLAHLRCGADGVWREEEMPIWLSPDESQPECPDYFFYHGFYYLVLSLHGTAQYFVSAQPFSGWRTPEKPEIPCGGVPKAAIWHDRVVFTGFDRIDGYGGNLTFRAASAAPDGTLIFD